MNVGGVDKSFIWYIGYNITDSTLSNTYNINFIETRMAGGVNHSDCLLRKNIALPAKYSPGLWPFDSTLNMTH